MVIIAPLVAITNTSLLSRTLFSSLDRHPIYFRHSRTHHNSIILVVVLESVWISQTSMLSFMCPIIRRHRDTSWTPGMLLVASRSYDTLLLTCQTSIVIIIVLSVSSLSKDLADQPTPADILAIHHTAISQLDALSCPVHPSKVKVEQCLDDAKGEADGEDIVESFLGETAKDPIENVEGAIGTEGNEIEAVDHSWD
jgi:hypothetical protein